MEDRELEAMAKANAAVKDLIEEERVRVIQWLAAKYMANYSASRTPSGTLASGGGASEGMQEDDDLRKFGSFAELLAGSSSNTPMNRVLLAAYWVQVVEGADSFKTFELNKNLNDTGYFDDNITKKLKSLRETKPAKIVQLAKSNVKQGHRTMKLITYGIAEAEKLLGKS